MSFIKDDDRVLKADFEVLSDSGIDEVVVRHKDQISLLDSTFHGVVRTDGELLGHFVQILYVHGLPSEAFGVTLLGVSSVNALVRLPSLSASTIQLGAFQSVDSFVHAKVVSRGYDHRARIVGRVFELFLHLSKLGMCPAGVDNAG